MKKLCDKTVDCDDASDEDPENCRKCWAVCIAREFGGSVAECSAHQNRNPTVLGSSSALKSSATLENSQLVCLRPVGNLTNVMYNLNYLFQLFARHH